VKSIAKEPMVILLLATSSTYFTGGKTDEALVMGPSCSIIYENEPIEKNSMFQKPRTFASTVFNLKELATIIIQRLEITVSTLFIYQYAVHQGLNEPITRTMVFTVLIATNIIFNARKPLLLLFNSTTVRYKNNLVLLIISITDFITGLLLYPKPLSNFFEFESLNFMQLSIAIATGLLSVIWYEGVKWRKRITGAKKVSG
jgi:Ca2+-transporting ATPase